MTKDKDFHEILLDIDKKFKTNDTKEIIKAGAIRLKAFGQSNQNICKAFSISKDTLLKYLKDDDVFREHFEIARELILGKLKNKMLEKALGEETIIEVSDEFFKGDYVGKKKKVKQVESSLQAQALLIMNYSSGNFKPLNEAHKESKQVDIFEDLSTEEKIKKLKEIAMTAKRD